jgi:uncharacterized membrane protein YbhN (UPF0104 family)
MNDNGKKRLVRYGLSLVGLVIFIILVLKIGLGVIIQNFSRVGAWFLVVCLLGVSWLFLQALAWSLIQRTFQPVPLWALFRAKLIADGLNTLLPAANMGGEAARAVIIKRYVPLQQGIPGVVFDKTIEYTASLFFLAAGLLISVQRLKVPQAVRTPSTVVLGAIAAGIITLVVLQFQGIYPLLKKLAPVIPGGRKWFLEREDILRELDGNMRSLFGQSKLKLVAAWGLHLAGRVLGAVEVYVILRALEVPTNWAKVLFISVFVVISNTAFFLMPGQWGVAEGAHLLVARMVRYSSAVGLTLGVVRRIRKVLFAGVAVILIVAGKERLKRENNANGG